MSPAGRRRRRPLADAVPSKLGQPGRWGDGRRGRIGILGGSFNPAHDGHRLIAETALKRLRLNAVWLLVSPGNPLKPVRGMGRFPARLASARAIAGRHPRLLATDLEARLGTRFTVDTLSLLRRRFRRARLVWLMGADNLVQIPRWQGWRRIFAMVPAAIFPRPGFTRAALSGRAARTLAAARQPLSRAAALARLSPPAWIFLAGREHPASATAIRAGRAAVWRRRAGRARVARPEAELDRLVRLIVARLEDDKAEGVVVLDLVGKAAFADRMVIASGLAGRQLTAMAEHLIDLLENEGVPGVRTEGLGASDWVLIDAGDVVVHLFRPEARAHYALEKMWGEALPGDEARLA